MLARRLLLLAAVLVLLTALAAGIAPQPQPADQTAGRAGALPAGAREPVVAVLSASEDDQSVTARVGDLIELEVAGDVLDVVEIERLERLDAIEPTTPARFEVLAEEVGVYPIRLVEADRRIGRLDVRP